MRVIIIGSDNSIEFGELTQHLRRLILCDLTILAAQYVGQGWELRRPEEALETFEDDGYALLVLPGDRLMMVTGGRPWFSPELVFSEEWVGHGVTTDDVAWAMRVVGRHFGATKFEVGTRATPGARHEAAARLYQRSGLRLATNVLVGDIDNG